MNLQHAVRLSIDDIQLLGYEWKAHGGRSGFRSWLLATYNATQETDQRGAYYLCFRSDQEAVEFKLSWSPAGQ